MRRQFALALGSCFAATAVGLAQMGPTARSVAPIRYATPFVVAPQKLDATENASMIEVAPANVARTMPANVQYVPVQAVQNGNMIQYVPVQMMQTPQGTVAMMPAPQGATLTPASPQTAVQMPAAMQANVLQVGMPPSQLPQSTTLQGAQPTTYQYIPVPQMQSTLSSTVTGMQPLSPVPPVASQSQGTTQYVPVQPMISTPTTPGTHYVQVQTGQATKAPANTAPAATVPATTTTGACPTNNCGAQPSCNINTAPCGPAGQYWLSAEYLLWWADGTGVPPLVTSSPAGTPRAQAGVLGQPGTTVLFGGDDLNDGNRSGFRIRGGTWLDCCRTCGIEGSYFFLGDETSEFNGTATGRPFFNATTNQPDAELVDYPGVVTGRINVRATTSLNGFDINARKNINCDPCRRLDWLVGFRYMQLNDDLTITEDLTSTDTASVIPPGTRFQVEDFFETRNEFYGAQIGLAGERRSGQYFVSYRGLIGFGTTHKEATINGSTVITQPGGAPQQFTGGLLALPTNIGRYTKNDFSVIPELGINAGYQFSENLRVFVGYSFIYWSNVTRVGDIIDPVVNTTQLPPGTLVGAPRPAFSWNDSDFWAHGISFGAEMRY